MTSLRSRQLRKCHARARRRSPPDKKFCALGGLCVDGRRTARLKPDTTENLLRVFPVFVFRAFRGEYFPAGFAVSVFIVIRTEKKGDDISAIAP